MSDDLLSAIFTADVSPEWATLGDLVAGVAVTLTWATMETAMDEIKYGPLPTVDDILNEGLQAIAPANGLPVPP